MGELIKFPHRIQLSRELQQEMKEQGTLQDYITGFCFAEVVAEIRKQLKETKDARRKR